MRHKSGFSSEKFRLRILDFGPRNPVLEQNSELKIQNLDYRNQNQNQNPSIKHDPDFQISASSDFSHH